MSYRTVGVSASWVVLAARSGILKAASEVRRGLAGIVRINVAGFEAREQCAPMSAEAEAEPSKDTLESTADLKAAERDVTTGLLMVPGESGELDLSDRSDRSGFAYGASNSTGVLPVI